MKTNLAVTFENLIDRKTGKPITINWLTNKHKKRQRQLEATGKAGQQAAETVLARLNSPDPFKEF